MHPHQHLTQPPYNVPPEGYKDATDGTPHMMFDHHTHRYVYEDQVPHHSHHLQQHVLHPHVDMGQWPQPSPHHDYPHDPDATPWRATYQPPLAYSTMPESTNSADYFHQAPQLDDRHYPHLTAPYTIIPCAVPMLPPSLPSHLDSGRSLPFVAMSSAVDFASSVDPMKPSVVNFVNVQPPPDYVEVPNQCLERDCMAVIRYRGYCKLHGGARKCCVVSCTKGIQGRNRCIAHGGGKRCQHTNCVRAAQSHGLCKSHGGGTRCKFHGCPKTAQGGGFCRMHGGGRKCKWPGCTNSAQREELCAKHGQKRICSVLGCDRTDRGGGFCMNHRKDKICCIVTCTRLIATTAFAGQATMCAHHVSEHVAATTDPLPFSLGDGANSQMSHVIITNHNVG
ncbi:hypothetical protein H310_08103 [Aphanomyces invadans]|uniref:WRKY19-like zinc finger domain-containing protein n=1 Tax=Aphanomyces invadans TaxID=157072 RepID=A0A024TZM8_9STRA|nr:hypothetical protein H310_08103 [Aphanomyces invadans]ETV99399.1 hypothetical protein H310_08103 [Aphanomyces invadans]|eukprot:XP_008871955.1 hypothetical protein H310_08103 [Aphanomyces invadans]